jgi:hypothetical protein
MFLPFLLSRDVSLLIHPIQIINLFMMIYLQNIPNLLLTFAYSFFFPVFLTAAKKKQKNGLPGKAIHKNQLKSKSV